LPTVKGLPKDVRSTLRQGENRQTWREDKICEKIAVQGKGVGEEDL